LNDSAGAQVLDAAQICSTPAAAQRSCARDSVTAVAAVVAASTSPADAYRTATASLALRGPVGQNFATQLQDFFSQPKKSSVASPRDGRNSNSAESSQEFAADCEEMVAKLCRSAPATNHGRSGENTIGGNDSPEPVARCVVSYEKGGVETYRCKVKQDEGLECTDENCNPNHPPRCVASAPDKRLIGTCTLNYDDAEVGNSISEQTCFADTDCTFVPACDARNHRCVPGFMIPDNAFGGYCSKIGNDRDCEKKRCHRDKAEKCSLGGTLEYCAYDQDCGSPRYCDPNGAGRCDSKISEPKGKLCYEDANCDGKPSKSYCTPDGKCSADESYSFNRECVLGYDDACQIKTCREGSCVTKLDWSYYDTPCENNEECETRTDCFERRGVPRCVPKVTFTGVNACKRDSDCHDPWTPRVCTKKGACSLAPSSYVQTCWSHLDCSNRGYPDYCGSLSEQERLKDPLCGVDFARLTPLEAGSTTIMARLSTDAVQQQREEANAHAKVEQAIKPAEVVKRLRGAKPSHVWGKANAKVTLAIFQDLACGQCKRVHRESFAELTQSFIDTGKLKVEFYEFPLIMGKDVARHYGALCAGRQGKYVQFVEKVYENFKEYDVGNQARYAKTVEGLDLAQWDRCMSKPDSLAFIVKSHKEAGSSIGVDGTPTLFLNGEGVSNFREVLISSVAKLTQ